MARRPLRDHPGGDCDLVESLGGRVQGGGVLQLVQLSPRKVWQLLYD
ncbi:hypothetical protein ACFRFH_12535 [Leifsonia sp. NPDC056824]